MVGWHHRLNGRSLSKLQKIVKDREAWCAAVHSRTLIESDVTEQLNNKEVTTRSPQLSPRPAPSHLSSSHCPHRTPILQMSNLWPREVKTRWEARATFCTRPPGS